MGARWCASRGSPTLWKTSTWRASCSSRATRQGCCLRARRCMQYKTVSLRSIRADGSCLCTGPGILANAQLGRKCPFEPLPSPRPPPPRASLQEAAVQQVGGLTGGSGAAGGAANQAARVPKEARRQIEEAIEAAFTQGSGGCGQAGAFAVHAPMPLLRCDGSNPLSSVCSWRALSQQMATPSRPPFTGVLLGRLPFGHSSLLHLCPSCHRVPALPCCLACPCRRGLRGAAGGHRGCRGRGHGGGGARRERPALE